MKRPVALYHKNCIDGTMAAAVFLRRFPTAYLIPIGYDYSPADIEKVLSAVSSAGGDVYTLDCCIAAKEILASGYPVTSIDHHIGIREEMEALAGADDRYSFVFDDAKSGASLAWAHLFPGEEVPEVVTLVEDYDLWNWRHGSDTKDVNNYLSLYVNQPERMSAFLDRIPSEVRHAGATISLYKEGMIDQLIKKSARLGLEVGETIVPAYNITLYESEAGNRLSKESGKAVILFTIAGKLVKISARSLDGQRPSALDVAAALGGGGHVNSAGAEVPLDRFISLIRHR